MKKTVLLGLTGLALVGGYTGLWQYNAGKMNSELEASLAAHKDTFTVTSSAVNGFPGSPNMDLNGLNLTFKDIATIQMEHVDIKMGITKKSYDVHNISDIELKSTALMVDGKPLDFVSKASKDDKIHVAFRSNQLMNFLSGKASIHPLNNEPLTPNAWKDLEKLEWSTSSSELLDKNSGAVLLKGGPSSSKISIDPIDTNNHTISLKMSAKDSEFTKDADAFMDKIMDSLMDTLAQNGLNTGPKASSMFSALGKLSYDVDVTYKGLTNPEMVGKEPVRFDLNIAKYEASSQLSTSSMKGQFIVALNEKAEPTDLTVKLMTAIKVTPEYMVLFKKQFQDMIAQTPTSTDADAAIQLMILESIEKFMPDLSALGEIKFNYDMKADVANKNFDVNEVSLNTDRSGLIIKAKGNLNDQTNPQVQADITMKNYEVLVSDLFDFVVAAQLEAKKAGDLPVDIKLDENLKQKILEFLKTVATKTDGDSKDMNIKISLENGQVKVGEMDGAEAAMALMMLMAPQQ